MHMGGADKNEKVNHPRIRGEYLATGSTTCITMGSPPHAQGMLTLLLGLEMISGSPPHMRGIPACLNSLNLYGDHPRMRGEYSSDNVRKALDNGSPPHARGILSSLNLHQCKSGIAPACAGNTLDNLQ